MTRVAAVDCGTNSIRLLIADADPATGEIRDLDRRMIIVRLGQGVDRTGRLHPDALERTFAACREYAAAIREHGATAVRFVATSASRDAENRDDFTRGVREILGVDPEVVSGDTEARFSFTGATRELAGAADAAEGPYLVVDIGGGSTEFVVGTDTVEAARSVDIGSVRMTERHLMDGGRLVDPPTPDRVEAIRTDVRAALDVAERTVPLRSARTLVGLAGSVTTIAALTLGLDRYDSGAVHHSRVSRADADRIAVELLTADHATRAARPAIHPGRVDVIGSGALILSEIMNRTGASEVLVSEHDILDGIAWSIA